ncbi:MAG: zinc finger domain-containing protein, partial [Porticoccaceae bacterium]
VYGRGGEACKKCGTTLKELKLGQRSSVYCPSCQT